MAKIPEYDAQVLPQGQINVRSDPNDFGAQVWGAVGNLANAASEVVEAQDVTRQHANMAKARVAWTQSMQERVNQAQPGDDTFAPKLMEDMEKYFADSADSATTRRGKQVYSSLASNMVSEFGQRAVGVQADLDGRQAVQDYEDISTSYSNLAMQDPAQREVALAHGKMAIFDPTSIFAKVPAPKREELWSKYQERVNESTLLGMNKTMSGAWAIVSSVSPEAAASLGVEKRIIEGNKVAGGRVDISPATMAKAPRVLDAAATHGVSGNVVLAQLDRAAPNTDPMVVAQDMGALKDAVGPDPTKALAAFHMGPQPFAALLEGFPNDWFGRLPQPTQEYVQGVMESAGQVPSENPPANPTPVPVPPTRVESALAALNALPPEKQAHIFAESVQTVHMYKTMAREDRAEEEYQRQQTMKPIVDGYFQQIFDRAQYGDFSVKAVNSDPRLDTDKRSWLINVFNSERARQRGLSSETDPATFNALIKGIVSRKIVDMTPVDAALAKGAILYPAYRILRDEVTQLKDGDGTSYGKAKGMWSKAMDDEFKRSPLAILPGVGMGAFNLWWSDMITKEKKLRDEGKDPSAMWDPKSSDCAIKASDVARYLTMAQSGAASGGAEALAKASGRKAEDGMEAGKTYTDKTGRQMTYIGGPKKDPASWVMPPSLSPQENKNPVEAIVVPKETPTTARLNKVELNSLPPGFGPDDPRYKKVMELRAALQAQQAKGAK